MQYNDDKSLKSITRPRLARTRMVGMDSEGHITGPLSNSGDLGAERAGDIADQPTTVTSKSQILAVSKAVRLRLPTFFQGSNWNAPLEDQSTAHLVQLSGMMRSLRST